MDGSKGRGKFNNQERRGDKKVNEKKKKLDVDQKEKFYKVKGRRFHANKPEAQK